MKNEYERPVIEFVELTAEDVITTSCSAYCNDTLCGTETPVA